jgi:hypothetical protein
MSSPPPPPPVRPPDDDFDWPAARRESPKRTWKIVALTAIVLVVALVGLGVYGALRGGRPVARGTAATPTGAAQPTVVTNGKGAPSGVKLLDDESSITVTWNDPTKGTVQFAVLGGPSGEQPQLRGLVEPGTTKLTVMGVNASIEYCFVVEAIYSVSELAQSSPVCTHRHG